MTVDKPVHPPKDQLIAFGQGKLVDEEASRVAQHLEVCRECCETLLDLKDDTFTGLVRNAKASEPVADAASVRTDPGPDASCVGHGIAEAATLAVQSGEPLAANELPIELAEHPRYRIVELIGRGGMGCVYRAEHRLMNRTVAIKVINPQLVQNAQAVERFRREVQAAAKLSHPNIVTAYDAEQAGNAHFLVMEFVEGTDLASVVNQRGPMSVAEACDCIRQAADGLEHAHERGMVHRDIKPHNLMLTASGQVRILDFGLAGFATEFVADAASVRADDTSDAGSVGHAHLTAIGSVMGTPDYMAPEQAANAHAADIRADIYSLGCTLHFLLTGKPPFEADSVVAKLMAHVDQPPPTLTSTRTDAPLELSAVVARMMAKNPAERFQTPAEVAAALASFSRPAVTPPRKRTLRKLLAAAAAILLAGVIYITTDKGRIEIRTEVGDVDVVVSHGGREIKTIDLATGSQVTWMPSGEYTISLKQDRNDIIITPSGFTLSRWGKQIVSLSRLPAAPVAPSADVAQGPPNSAFDKLLLQELWIAVSGHAGGQPIPAEQLPKFSITIDQDRITIALPGTPSQVQRGTFKNNATSTPRQIDIVVADKKEPMAGIYEVDHKRLKLALVDGDAARPTDFSPIDRAGHITAVFERAPETGMSEYVEFKPAGLNGGFEITKFGLPVNWSCYTPRTVPDGDFDIVMDKTDFKEGEQSLKFVVRKCKPTGGWHSPGFFNDFRIENFTPPGPFETKPGETYKVSFWAKNDGSEFVFKARGVSPLAGDKGVVIRSKETFHKWRQFECTYTIPPGPKMHLRLELNVVQSGTFWIDDLQVVKVDEKAPATPGASDEARLQGKWIAVSGHARKQPIPVEQLAQLSITFDGERVTLTQPGNPPQSNSGTFTINPNTVPKQITLLPPDKRETLPGIYEFDGEQLKLAFVDEDYARPTNFDPDDRADHMTLVLERAPLTGPAIGQTERETSSLFGSPSPLASVMMTRACCGD